MSDNQYLNLIINNPVNGSNRYPRPIPASYDESFTLPVLNNPRDYYCSVLRWSLPVDGIPILLFPANPLQNVNVNQADWIVGVQSSGLNFEQNVIYVPNNNFAPPVFSPTPPYLTQDQLQSQYYFIFSVQPVINMVNTALDLAFVASGSPGGGTAPYFIYDPLTQLISLIVTSAFLGTGAKIFMNAYLKTYFDSFVFTIEDDPITGSYLYYFDLSTLPYGGTSPYQFKEEYNALDLWFDIRKIVIVTSSIPITTEASPIFLPGSTTNGSAQYIPILADFIISYDNINDISSIVVYNPTAQYKLIDMNGSPISRINFQFFWQTENGSLFPVMLSPGQAATLKLGFFRKDLYLH